MPSQLASQVEERSASLTDVRELVVVASSSRSGSSYLMALLQQCCPSVFLPGEYDPYLRLTGGDYPRSGRDSDALGPEHVNEELAALLSAELGWPANSLASGDLDVYVRDVHHRLRLQWPQSDVRYGTTARAVDAALSSAPALPSEALFVRILEQLAAEHPEIDPRRYDLGAPMVCEALQPLPAVLEQPPFIVPLPWIHADASALATRPTVLKSPSSAYRLDFLQRLFPAAEIRILHLVRNPAAAINGLCDGWKSNAFHSHRLDEGTLAIDGYSHLAGGDRWWKFDLPPGWQDYRRADLVSVCAFQWAAAHTSILRWIDGRDLEGDARRYLRVPFERLVAGDRAAELGQLVRWLTGRPPAARANGTRMPVVMATEPPRPGRWREREAQIAPALEDSLVRTLAQELGYGDDPSRWL